MKRWLAGVLVFILCGLLLPLVPAMAEEGTAPAPERSVIEAIASGSRELSLLVLGIGWEAVRIALPEACPMKEKDIDGIVSSLLRRGEEQ